MDKKWQDILDEQEGKDVYSYWELEKEEEDYPVEKIEEGYFQKIGLDHEGDGYLIYDHYVAGQITGFKSYKNLVGNVALNEENDNQAYEFEDMGGDSSYSKDESEYPIFFTPNWGNSKDFSKIEDYLIFIFKKFSMGVMEKITGAKEIYFHVRWIRNAKCFVSDPEKRTIQKDEDKYGDICWFEKVEHRRMTTQDKHSYFHLKKGRGFKYDIKEIKNNDLPSYGLLNGDSESVAYSKAMSQGLKEWDFDGEKWDINKYMKFQYGRYVDDDEDEDELEEKDTNEDSDNPDYECTMIVGDSGYSALSKKEQKGFELVGLYDQEYIQKVLRDNKLATPYEKRSEWSDDPKETFDFIFNELTNGFADLLKLSEVEKLEDVETNIYIKTLPKHMGPYKDGDLSEDEFLLEEKKAKKKGLLFIPKLFITKLHLLGAEDWQEECIDEDWKMENFCWMGSIDYEEICKEVDDVNLWVHKEMPLNLAQLEKIYGNGKNPFVEHSSTPLYEAHFYPSSFAEIFEWAKIDSLIVCKEETVVPIPEKAFVIRD